MNSKNIKRRSFLKKVGVAGATIAASTSLATPALSDNHKEWILVSAFGKAGLLGQAIQSFAKKFNDYSDKLKIKVFHAGELVPGLEALDAVRSGAAQMSYGAPYYWSNVSDAIEFVATTPFGMNAMEQNAWCYYGGGIEAADKIYNSLGLKFLPMGNTGNQMGGWFNKEINEPGDYNGLKMRMPGLGGRTIKKLGATPVLLAGPDVLPSLSSGAVDAAEWICPAADLGAGLYQAAKYYYGPGWHEPSTLLDLSIDLKAWEKLDKSTQGLIDDMTKSFNMTVFSRFQAANGPALQKLLNVHNVKLKKFPDTVLTALGNAAGEVISERGSINSETKAICNHLLSFRKNIMDWSTKGESEFARIRNLSYKYPDSV
jgi:TRAP-type mannitol/chloroaromatic compound transport system substrate-binding protein